MSSNYEIIRATKTFCGECSHEVELLKPKCSLPYLPAFYICINCNTIGEVAAGPVPRV